MLTSEVLVLIKAVLAVRCISQTSVQIKTGYYKLIKVSFAVVSIISCFVFQRLG